MYKRKTHKTNEVLCVFCLIKMEVLNMHEDASFNIVGRSLIIQLNCELDHHISEQLKKRIDNI